MSPKRRAPYARQSVWIFVAILSVIVVIGFLAAGYEINHQRTEINTLHSQVQGLTESVSYLQNAVKLLNQR